MPIQHVLSFYKLYKLSKKYSDDYYTEVGGDILYKAGFRKHYINYASFNREILDLPTPAFSLGFNIIYPFGAVFVNEEFKKLKKNWLKYIIAHETAHIILNHYPLNILLSEGIASLPPNIRVLIELYRFTSASLNLYKEITSPLEGITAEKELDADEWAVKVISMKKPAIEFLTWLKEKGLKISHYSPYTGLPALSIDERIRRIKKIRLR